MSVLVNPELALSCKSLDRGVTTVPVKMIIEGIIKQPALMHARSQPCVASPGECLVS